MQQNEVWKAIPGGEGRYEVSSLGRVRSLLNGGRILRPGRTGRGYLVVNPMLGPGRYPKKVHHLVLFAFVGPRPDGMVACHNNDVPDDNRIDNLRWDTIESNIADRKRHGGYRQEVKLTEADALAILSDPRLSRQVAAEYGVSQTAVRDIRNGRCWKHLPRNARCTQAELDAAKAAGLAIAGPAQEIALHAFAAAMRAEVSA